MCEWIERGKENRWEEIEGKRKLGSSRNKASKVGWNIVEAIVVNLKGKKRNQQKLWSWHLVVVFLI